MTTVDAEGVVGRPHRAGAGSGGPTPHQLHVRRQRRAALCRLGPGTWSITELRRGWQVAGATSLVLEPDGRVRISFYDPGWRSLRLATGSPFGVYLPILFR